MQWACLLSTSGQLMSALDLNQNCPSWKPVQLYTRFLDLIPSEGKSKRRGLKFYASETPPTSSGDEGPSFRVTDDQSTKSIFGLIDSNTTYNLFPELRNLPSKVVTYMDFFLLDDDEKKYRLSAFGTLDGWVGVGLVDMTESELKVFYSVSHDSMITKLKFFRQFNQNSTLPADISLLVCSGLEPAVVYRCPFDDNQEGKLSIGSRLILPQSADFDHVNCACVTDLDFDGQPEIIIGTFGQRLLFYKWISQPDSENEGSYFDNVSAGMVPTFKVVSGDFADEDRHSGGGEKVVEDAELEAILNEDSCQTLEELSELLGGCQ
nr:kaptin [Hymenolepis microstoma]